MPPIVQLDFAPSLKVTSPGAVLGSLYAFDDDGLRDLRLRITSADSSFVLDSTLVMNGLEEQTRPVDIAVPAGLPTGTRLALVVTVGDFAGFVTTDSSVFLTQDP